MAFTYNIHTEIVLPASPEKVWAVFSDYTKWGDWNDFMTFAEPPAEVGKHCHVVFRLEEGCMPVSRHHPEILVIEPNKELRWRDDRGPLMNLFFHGSHWFVFSKLPSGHTKMVHGCQLHGLALPFLPTTLRCTTKGYTVWNEGLKKAVEASLKK